LIGEIQSLNIGGVNILIAETACGYCSGIQIAGLSKIKKHMFWYRAEISGIVSTRHPPKFLSSRKGTAQHSRDQRLYRGRVAILGTLLVRCGEVTTR